MMEVKFSGDPAVVKMEMQQFLAGTISHASVVGQPTTTQQTEKPAAEKQMTAAQKKAAEKAAAKAAVEKQAVQTGEERVGPEDTPEVEKQDAADEAADKAHAEEMNHDSVRAALGAYVKKFGMAAAQEDGPKVLALALGAEIDKVSLIPDKQDAFRKAIEGINEMTSKNPYKRELV